MQMVTECVTELRSLHEDKQIASVKKMVSILESPDSFIVLLPLFASSFSVPVPPLPTEL
jgi:hypothetical protein